MRLALVVTFVSALVAAPSALAQSMDASAGAHLAKTECAVCHAIGDDAKAKSPDPKAPRFVDVAQMSSTTELSLKVFLRSSHRNMPNIMLAPEEIDSVATYVLGLKKK